MLYITNRVTKPPYRNTTITDSQCETSKNDSHLKDDKTLTLTNNETEVVEYSRRRWPKGKTATKDEGEVREVENYESKEGGIYTGTLKNGKRNGKGTLKLSNKDEYIGEWCNDEFEGKGKLIRANKDVLEGTWLAGKLNGEGKIKLSNGYKLEAIFVNGEAQGKGKEIDENGTIYEGDFLEGKRHGKGIMRFKGGRVYEGQFKDGVPHDKGKLTKGDGSVYEGILLINTCRKFCERKARWIWCLHLG